MLVGCITSQGVRVSVDDALAHAWATGDFDGWDAVTLTALLTRQDRNYLGMSAIFGRTLRKAVLQYRYDYYLDLAQAWKTLRGTWLHKGFEEVNVGNKAVMREVSLTAEVEGIPIEGTVDLYIPYLQSLYDLKSIGQIWDVLPYDKHVGQISGYKWLLETNGYEVSQGYLVYVTFSAYRKYKVAWWSETKVLDYIRKAAEVFYAGINKGVIPGKKQCQSTLCKVCEVREICKGIADG